MSHFLKYIYILLTDYSAKIFITLLYLTVLVSVAMWGAVWAFPLAGGGRAPRLLSWPRARGSASGPRARGSASRPWAWGSVFGPGLQGTGSLAVVRGLLLQAMCDLPAPGIEPESPVLAGGFFNTETSGKTPGKKLKIENVLFSPHKIQTVLT